MTRIQISHNKKSYSKAVKVAVIILICGFSLLIAFNSSGVNSKNSSNAILDEASSQSSSGSQHQRPRSPSTSLAFQQSFGFFDDITDEDWKMRQEKARKHRHHDGNPLYHWGKGTPASMFYYYNYEPLFSCPHLHRVGGPGDGPKWTCDPYRVKKAAARRNETCLVYSIGCAGWYLWEDGLNELLGNNICEFHIFDPGNYERDTNAASNIHYHKWGIKSSYHDDSRSTVFDEAVPFNGTFLTFPETLRKLGHEHRTIDLMKADCEYCEWYSYKDWIKHDVRQLMVETHHLPLPETVPDFWPWPGTNMTPNQFFDDLEAAGFIMFSKEPNTHWANKGNLVEWSFIKLDKGFLRGP